MLRSFVGDNSTEFSETDLSTCLRQCGYLVELAAERLMTGQYHPPAKRRKVSTTPSTQPLSAVRAPSPKHMVSTPNMAKQQQLEPSATYNSNRKKPTISTTTSIRRPAPVTPKTPLPTSSTSSSSSRSTTAKSTTTDTSRSTPNKTNDKTTTANVNDWLLCHRWVSDGVCTYRNGCMQYQERLSVEGSEVVRFRGARIQGQFPKHLSQLLGPLLQHQLVSVEAQALMEERHLPMGAQVAFGLR